MQHLNVARKHDQEQEPIQLLGNMVNRHGLIAGATGTGKSVSLRKMAESLSDAGVPVFLVDVKGEFSGLTKRGLPEGKVAERAQKFGLDETYYHGFPVRFWDVYGQLGIPLRIKLSSIGSMLLARLLGLNKIQEGVLNLVFKVADDNEWLLVDLKDLRALLKHVADHASKYKTTYGSVSSVTIGAIQRQLLSLEQDGGDLLFGEPAIELGDFCQIQDGRGLVNVLIAERLLRSPSSFSAFLLWLLAQLYTDFPEVGDLELPKLVLFFDEAHLLFKDASQELLSQIEQVVRLIRSKGVGVYFCTQSPLDLPQTILGQLGNRIQHALRAYTPKDQKAVRAAAETFRSNPKLNVAETISTLGVGEALVSFLDEKGMPQPVEYALILVPASQLTPLGAADLSQLIEQDPLYEKYKDTVDNYSAFEAILEERQVLQEADVETRIQNSPVKGERQVASDPSPIVGFFRGLFGLRKHQRAGMGYEISNQLGKEFKQGLSKGITRTILGVIKKR
ncbi:MAG: helicase HerA-like domain-containing protein [Neisseriaceae bacterium]